MSSVRTDSFKSAEELSEPVREALSPSKRLSALNAGEYCLPPVTLQASRCQRAFMR